MPALSNLPTTDSFQLSLPCEIEQVRPAAQALRTFLENKGVANEELMPCELAFVEACNNAVLYAMPSCKLDPIEVEVNCDEALIEIKIHDHTAGFVLPEKAGLAEDDSESGRGVFIMQSVMDAVSYAGAIGENTLTLQKARITTTAANIRVESVEELKVKLTESEEIINEMAEELSSCYESLSAIFRSGTELGKMDNLQNFSRTLCHDLLKITSADWYLLRVVPKRGSLLNAFASTPSAEHLPPLVTDISKAGVSAELKAAAYRKDVFFDHQNQLDEKDPLRTMPTAETGMVHPFYFAETLIGTLTIGKTKSDRPFTAAHVNVVHTLADFLTIQIVNARIYEEQLNNRLVTRELEIAQEIQQALLPKTLPHLRGFGLAGYCESARHVGGDFYDVVTINDHSALLIVADVMGKGVPAAMFAAILRSILRGAPELVNQPAALLSRVNGLLYQELSEVDMFITAQLCFVDMQTREIVVASAGHCPALIFCGNDPAPKVVSPEGMPLGILRDTLFTEQREPLSSGCRIVLYTDGVTDCRNSSEEFFGRERLVQWMGACSELRTAEELKDALATELKTFQEATGPFDDQTFLILAEETT